LQKANFAYFGHHTSLFSVRILSDSANQKGQHSICESIS